MTRFMKIFTVVTVVAAFAAPSAAFAATASQNGYGDDNANILPAVQDNGGGDDGGDVAAAVVTDDEGGSLPFTGAELGVLAGAGALLVLLGFGLRRLTHKPTQA